jgi:hypothetical protein
MRWRSKSSIHVPCAKRYYSKRYDHVERPVNELGMFRFVCGNVFFPAVGAEVRKSRNPIRTFIAKVGAASCAGPFPRSLLMKPASETCDSNAPLARYAPCLMIVTWTDLKSIAQF